MLSCLLKPMMRISRRSCLKVQELDPNQFVNTSELTDENGQRFTDAPFDHSTYVIIDVTLRVFLTGMLATFGAVSNVINLVIFYRQGIMTNSPTVSLAALTVSDFFCCTFNVWGAVCAVLINFTDVSQHRWDVQGFLIFTAVRPLDMFTQITCWVTAFTAFERLFSVVFPFKVKAVFTPKRSLAALSCVFALTAVLYIPNSFEEIPVWERKRRSNLTYLGWEKSELRSKNIRRVFFLMCPVALRLASILIVLLCNIVIFWKVKLSQKFRLNVASAPFKTTHSGQTVTETEVTQVSPSRSSTGNRINSTTDEPEKKATKKRNSSRTVSRKVKRTVESSEQTSAATTSTSSKELKLLRMITVISGVFVMCYTMNAVYVILYYIVWKWGVDYHGFVDHTGWLVVTFFQTVNSSTNILIYQSMSSRFNEDLRTLCLSFRKRFCCKG